MTTTEVLKLLFQNIRKNAGLATKLWEPEFKSKHMSGNRQMLVAHWLAWPANQRAPDSGQRERPNINFWPVNRQTKQGMSLWHECVRPHAHTLTCKHHTHGVNQACGVKQVFPGRARARKGSAEHISNLCYDIIYQKAKTFVKIPIMILGRWINKCLPHKH